MAQGKAFGFPRLRRLAKTEADSHSIGTGPLSESCTFIAYESVRDLANEANLEYLSDRVLERYEEESEE